MRERPLVRPAGVSLRPGDLDPPQIIAAEEALANYFAARVKDELRLAADERAQRLAHRLHAQRRVLLARLGVDAPRRRDLEARPHVGLRPLVARRIAVVLELDLALKRSRAVLQHVVGELIEAHVLR